MACLKVVTLNCWGIPIPVLCKKRSERIQAIGAELAKGNYHIVVLEEIWLKTDYETLCNVMSQTLPHSHYFYSGPIGSGVCVFSKLPILETFFHQFHLNGHAYKVHHGDWFGGKGVGLCKINFQGFKINLYVTHIHAEYDRGEDEYLPHRVSQAFEMSQFVRLTSAECDVLLVAGDFNLEPTDVGYNVLRTNVPLSDAWQNKKSISETNKLGATCECPWNRYRDKALATVCPDGKRIDYIMYKAHPAFRVEVEKCYTTLQQIPGKDFPFSDHEGVAAHLQLTKTSADGQAAAQHHSSLTEEEAERSMAYLRAAGDILESGERQTRATMFRFQLQALGLTVLLFWLYHTDLAAHNPHPVPELMGVVKVGGVVVVAALVWLSLVVKRGEMRGLMATRNNLLRLLEQRRKRE